MARNDEGEQNVSDRGGDRHDMCENLNRNC